MITDLLSPLVLQGGMLGALCLAGVVVRGWRSGKPHTLRSLGADALGTVAVVLVFALLTGGRGCASSDMEPGDCQPSPQGFICNE